MNEYTTGEVRALAEEIGARKEVDGALAELAARVLTACADGRVFADKRVREPFADLLGES